MPPIARPSDHDLFYDRTDLRAEGVGRCVRTKPKTGATGAKEILAEKEGCPVLGGSL
jgi:hypothetical protein